MLLGRPATCSDSPIPQAGSPMAFEALGPARFAMGDTVRFLRTDQYAPRDARSW